MNPGKRTDRGVFELTSECDCFRVFLIRDSQGKTRRIVKIPADEYTVEEVDNFWYWLDQRDPALKLIRNGEPRT